jgi:hypothetical protein
LFFEGALISLCFQPSNKNPSMRRRHSDGGKLEALVATDQPSGFFAAASQTDAVAFSLDIMQEQDEDRSRRKSFPSHPRRFQGRT